MIDSRTSKDLRDLPVLDRQVYIYIMKNDCDKIKIGKTHNIYERYMSLSGSNGQGNKIELVYCYPTYLETLERVLHGKFSKHRINGTEWFTDIGFYDVVFELNSIVCSDAFKICEEARWKLN